MATPVRVHPSEQNSLSDGALSAIAALKESTQERKSPMDVMNLPTALAHCTDYVTMSLEGYPKEAHSPWIIKSTLGRLSLKMMMMKGSMSHDTDAFIPGEEKKKIANTKESISTAVDNLTSALTSFISSSSPLSDHYLFGKLTKEQYLKIHIFHIYSHLSRFMEAGGEQSKKSHRVNTVETEPESPR